MATTPSPTPAAELLEKRRLAEIARRPRHPFRDALKVAFWWTLYAGAAALGWHYGPAAFSAVVARAQDIPVFLANAYPWPHLLGAVFVATFIVARVADLMAKEG
jgi:hypothetical protein